MGDSFKMGVQYSPYINPYNDLPPSYEESQKHEKVEDISVPGNTTYQQALQPSGLSHQPNKTHIPQYYPAQSPQCHQAIYQQQTLLQTSPYPQQQEVFIPGAFDAGARFTHTSPPSIPPPPPGIAPNAAQIAARAGAKVVTSKKQSFLG